MKNAIRSLEGVQILTSKERKVIKGGKKNHDCTSDGCANGYYCAGTACKLDPGWA
ncbi:hypothetical protein [Flavobacterium sp.]|uniref:hypothetical protein n=1 Tax=Flavobacterium sp. TaxID=239 RepID=UPI004048DB20